MGEAVVLDCSKHLRRIVDVDVPGRVARVQPGLVLDDLNRALRPYRLFFPVDPSTASRATLGGMAANNSSGARSIRYGNMVHNVRSIEAILADGTARPLRRPADGRGPGGAGAAAAARGARRTGGRGDPRPLPEGPPPGGRLQPRPPPRPGAQPRRAAGGERGHAGLLHRARAAAAAPARGDGARHLPLPPVPRRDAGDAGAGDARPGRGGAGGPDHPRGRAPDARVRPGDEAPRPGRARTRCSWSSSPARRARRSLRGSRRWRRCSPGSASRVGRAGDGRARARRRCGTSARRA